MSDASVARNGQKVINDALIFVSQRNMLRHVFDDSHDIDSMLQNIKLDSEVSREDLIDLLSQCVENGSEEAIKDFYDENYRY